MNTFKLAPLAVLALSCIGCASHPSTGKFQPSTLQERQLYVGQAEKARINRDIEQAQLRQLELQLERMRSRQP